MTKMEILMDDMSWINGLQARLDTLLEQKRITGGARFYIHNPYRWYGYEKLSEIKSKACDAKNYRKYVQVHVRSWDINYYHNDIMTKYAEALTFVEEQESLPFEQTQYQTLEREGKFITEETAQALLNRPEDK